MSSSDHLSEQGQRLRWRLSDVQPDSNERATMPTLNGYRPEHPDGPFVYACHACGTPMLLITTGPDVGGSACPEHGPTFGTWVPERLSPEVRAQLAQCSPKESGGVRGCDGAWIVE